MDMFPIAVQWFLIGLAAGFMLNGLIWLSISWGSGGKRWQSD